MALNTWYVIELVYDDGSIPNDRINMSNKL
jgi:hypothetical protein